MRIETIGNATLYLGDCREILPTLPDGCADMIFTDPPYGHNNNNGDLIQRREVALGLIPTAGSSPRAIANDGAEAEEIFLAALAHFPRLLVRGGCCCCCCCGGGPDPMFARWSLALDGPLQFKQMIVWDKGPMGMGWHYRRSYETVLVAQKKGGPCKWYDETDAVENIIRPGQYGIRKIIPQKTDHPTPKPPEMAAHFMRLHSLPGETVLDPFAGALSTGLAAVAMGRKFIGVELDERWFEMGLRRLEDAVSRPRLPLDEPRKAEQMIIL